MQLPGQFLCGLCVLWALSEQAQAQEFTTLKGHGGPIMDIAVSVDGRVATASFDNSVGVWSGRTPRWKDGHDAAVNVVRHMPDGALISAGDDFSIRFWPAEGAPVLMARHAGKIVDLDYNPQTDTIASASWDGSIGLIGPGKEALFLRGHTAGVNAVRFTGDGRRLYSASVDGTIRLWDVQTGREMRQLVRHGFGINTLIFDEAAGWLVYGAVDGVTRVINPDGEGIADFTLDRRPILAMAHHPGSARLAVGDGHGFIMVLDTATWQITRDFRATRTGPVWALGFSPDGAVIYAGGLDDVAYAWPVAMLDSFDGTMGQDRSFLRDPEEMENGERQFMRKCSICHALEPGSSRKAGPTLAGLIGRSAGTVSGYPYSPILQGSAIIWNEESINALFDEGPDLFIPGSKMPMQVIAGDDDRADLIEFLSDATRKE